MSVSVASQLSAQWPSGPPLIAWYETLLQPRSYTLQVHRGRGHRSDEDHVYRDQLRLLWRARGLRTPLDGELAVAFEFAGRSVAGGNRLRRPDGSNLQKTVEDAANGILWVDDRQVVLWAGCIRRWDETCTPGVGIWVWPVEWPVGGPE